MASVHEARLDIAEGWLRRLDLGAYRYAEAARLAQTNHQLLTAWLKLVQADQPQSEPNAAEVVKVLSYPQLLELAIVVRFRRSEVRLADLAQLHHMLVRREALRDPGAPASRHPFVLRSFMFDGLRQCAQADTTLRRAIQYGGDGVAWNPLIAEFFGRVEFNDRLIIRWYPRGRDRGVVVDPQRGFGSPIVDGSGIPTYIISERHAGGETTEELAEDYSLTARQISDALAFEQSLAASLA